MSESTGGGLRFGVDTGGTFTDLVIEGDERRPALYKRPTTPDDPVRGLLDVVGAAARRPRRRLAELLERRVSCSSSARRGRSTPSSSGTRRATAFL